MGGRSAHVNDIIHGEMEVSTGVFILSGRGCERIRSCNGLPTDAWCVIHCGCRVGGSGLLSWRFGAASWLLPHADRSVLQFRWYLTRGVHEGGSYRYCVSGVWCGPLCIFCLVSPYLLPGLAVSGSTYGRSPQGEVYVKVDVGRPFGIAKVTLGIRDKDDIRGLACELTLTT